MTRVLAGLASVLLAVAVLTPLAAAPLEKDACDGLKTEQGKLDAAGVRADLAKGPDAAKGVLAPARLKEIERLIEIDEQIAFRCREIRVRAEPPPPPKRRPQAKPPAKPAGEEAGKDKEAAAPAPKPPAKAKAKPKAVAAPVPPPASAASPADAKAPPAPPVTPVRKAAPKPKPADAAGE